MLRIKKLKRRVASTREVGGSVQRYGKWASWAESWAWHVGGV